MTQISLFTAMVDSMLLSAVLTLLYLIMWRRIDNDRAVLLWACAQASWAVGLGLLLGRGVLPDVLSILLANACLVTSGLLIWAGTVVFVGRRMPLVPMLIIFGAYWISFPVLTYAHPDISARIVIVRVLLGLSLLGALLTFLRPVPVHMVGRLPRRVCWVGALSFVPLQATIVGSMLVVLADWTRDVPFFAHPVIIGSVIASGFSMLVWGITVLYLALDRRVSERQTSSEMHRFLVEQSMVSMWITQGARIVYVNRAFADLFGYRPDQLVDDMTILDLVVEEERPRLQKALQSFAQGQLVETFPSYRGLRKDGSSFYFEGQVRTVTGGEKPLVAGVLVDTTLQHQAREQERAHKVHLEEMVVRRTSELQAEMATRSRAEDAERVFRHVVDQVDAAVLLVDTQGQIAYANQSLANFLGQDAALLIDQTLDPRDPLQQAMQTALSDASGDWSGEVRLNPLAGCVAPSIGADFADPVTVAVAVSPVRNDAGTVTHHVLVATNISTRVQATDQMARAKMTAEQNSRSKSEFLANMSHELRTPLNAILGFSDMIRSEVWGPLADPHYGEYATDIHDSAAHLLKVINDVLDVSAVEQGTLKLHAEWCSLADVIESALRLIAPRARENSITLYPFSADTAGIALFADPLRLKQVFINLLSNAVKFTPPDGLVGVEAVRVANGDLVVTVYDSGIGMDPEGIQMALQRFGQVESSLSRRWEGTGLGLPLASELVALHGADLQIDSALDRGTRVSLRFPGDRCRIEDGVVTNAV